MQEIKLHISQSSTDASLRPVGNDLKSNNGYLVYSNIINNDLVTEFNVREFLDDNRNNKLSLDFFQYLKGNTNQQEFENIVYNDKKLSEVLNEYYNTAIRTNSTPNIKVINENLTGITTVSINNNNFSVLNNRIKEKESFLTHITEDKSFYVNVFLNKNESAIVPISFNELVKTSIENGIIYTQGFIDLNNKNNIFEGVQKPIKDVVNNFKSFDSTQIFSVDINSFQKVGTKPIGKG